jgi:hypothetical protein
MASLGRVPNAEILDGNPVDVSAHTSRTAHICAGRGDGQAASLHRHSLRARAGDGRREAAASPSQIAAAHLKNLRAAVLPCALTAILAACAPTLGDFERPAPSVLSDDLLPAAGKVAAGQYRKEPVSDFRYTDHERELRDRAWALLMPQLEKQFFMGWLAELRRTRLLTVEDSVPKRDDYLRELLGVNFRSSGARFARLEMDIQNDRARYPLFVEAANTVATFDRVRERSLAEMPDATTEEVQNAYGRIEENRLVVYAVQTSMRERADIYRYAFQRLMIETPDATAVGAERALLALEREIGVLPFGMPQKLAIHGK